MLSGEVVLADLEMIVFEAGILLVSAILIMQQLFASILPLLSANKTVSSNGN